MTEPRRVTAALIIIGNEILSGRTHDANLPHLAKRLNAHGIQLREARVVSDVTEAIVEAVNACRAAYDYVFTTGGIGPTHDDITAAAVAAAFGRRLIRHPEAEPRLRAYYARTNTEVTEARLRMAETPEGATLIDNSISVAPGFRVDNVFVMAGIPRVMQAMLEALLPELDSGTPMLSRTVSCHVPEGTIAAGLGALQDDFPDLDIGSYPFFAEGKPGTNLVMRGADPARLDAAVPRLKALIEALGGTPVEEAGDG